MNVAGSTASSQAMHRCLVRTVTSQAVVWSCSAQLRRVAVVQQMSGSRCDQAKHCCLFPYALIS